MGNLFKRRRRQPELEARWNLKRMADLITENVRQVNKISVARHNKS
jgi:hypothetical protein